jgi:hypothetical protein
MTGPRGGEAMARKHSGLGIVSFIISLASGLLVFLIFVMLAMIEVSEPGTVNEDSALAMLAGLLIIGLALADVVALVLGIVGAAQKDRKRVFPILGIIFSSCNLLGILMIVGFGLALQA